MSNNINNIILKTVNKISLIYMFQTLINPLTLTKSLLFKNLIDPKIAYEGYFIKPGTYELNTYVNLLLDVKSLINKEELKNKVTFSRLQTSYFDQISCDWCSISNSLSYHILEKIRDCDDIIKLNSIKTFYVEKSIDILQKSLAFRKNIDKNKKIQFDLNTISQEKKNIKFVKLIIDLAILAEILEEKWCPFKSMVEYYRNTNPNYLYPTDRLVYLAGKILSEKDNIVCIDCNGVVNELLESDKFSNNTGGYSVMKEFFEEVLKLL